MQINITDGMITQQRASFSDYLTITRLDHSTKHIFVVPGVVFAYLLRGVQNQDVLRHVLLGLVALLCIASANYVINEFLDRSFDKHHPTKALRTAVQKTLKSRWVFVEWLCLVVIGLCSAYFASITMLVIASLFALQGLVYNVRPLRSKDKAYLDVLSESVNNPLRLMIGWAMLDAGTLPPASIVLSYWLGGAFLMSAKRLSEYREIVASSGKELLERYRASFSAYTEISLTVSCFVYAMASSFFLAVFLVKYRIEYLVLMPLLIVLFGQYLALSMKPGSAAQKPEKLFREYGLVLVVAALAVGFLITTFFDVPALESLTEQRYISLQ
jgi:4-hydroxybenzoate polyprenyltransferase